MLLLLGPNCTLKVPLQPGPECLLLQQNLWKVLEFSNLSLGPTQFSEMIFNLFNSDPGSESSVASRRARPQSTYGEPTAWNWIPGPGINIYSGEADEIQQLTERPAGSSAFDISVKIYSVGLPPPSDGREATSAGNSVNWTKGDGCARCLSKSLLEWLLLPELGTWKSKSEKLKTLTSSVVIISSINLFLVHGSVYSAQTPKISISFLAFQRSLELAGLCSQLAVLNTEAWSL